MGGWEVLCSCGKGSGLLHGHRVLDSGGSDNSPWFSGEEALLRYRHTVVLPFSVGG